jgi:nitrate/nitrite-specific signal transduction histidine kinase
MATYTDDFTRMRQEADEAHEERQQLMRDIQHQVQEMADGVREQLAGFRHELQEMSDALKTELREFHTDLKTGGEIFRKQATHHPTHD